jgi:hypothetical protein
MLPSGAKGLKNKKKLTVTLIVSFVILKKPWRCLTCFFVYMYKKSEIDKLQAVFLWEFLPYLQRGRRMFCRGF